MIGTKISWAHATWNPWTGCIPVSRECVGCYADALLTRCGRNFNELERTKTWDTPLKLNAEAARQGKRAICFVCSLSRMARFGFERCAAHTLEILGGQAKLGQNFRSKYPPAEPEALRLLAPRRGLTATGESKSKNKSKNLAMPSSRPHLKQIEGEHIPVTVKLLLPPRQSRGNSLRIRNDLSARVGCASLGNVSGLFLAHRFVVNRGVRQGDRDGIEHGLDQADNSRNLDRGHDVDQFMRVLLRIVGGKSHFESSRRIPWLDLSVVDFVAVEAFKSTEINRLQSIHVNFSI